MSALIDAQVAEISRHFDQTLAENHNAPLVLHLNGCRITQLIIDVVRKLRAKYGPVRVMSAACSNCNGSGASDSPAGGECICDECHGTGIDDDPMPESAELKKETVG